jgi:hypothetical protein
MSAKSLQNRRRDGRREMEIYNVLLGLPSPGGRDAPAKNYLDLSSWRQEDDCIDWKTIPKLCDPLALLVLDTNYQNHSSKFRWRKAAKAAKAAADASSQQSGTQPSLSGPEETSQCSSPSSSSRLEARGLNKRLQVSLWREW